MTGFPRSLTLTALIGVAVGVIAWGGFNTVMEATNRTEFCVSCHVMETTVYPEYKTSKHFQNASGVRAGCADCHVPRDWTHKVVRKITATGELWHWVLGSIDTQEKFEAKRHTLARREWDRMRASGSQECRNCHSFEARDFHAQSAKAQQAMKAAMEQGKTCIDCHKGIAHQMPDVNAGHRADFAALEAMAASLAPMVGARLVSLKPVALTLVENDGKRSPGGDLSPATPVVVERVEADVLDITVPLWWRDGDSQKVFQAAGKRIAAARLTEAAAARVIPTGATMEDENGRVWLEGRLSARVAKGGFIADRTDLDRYAARVNEDACTLCHARQDGTAAKADDWIGHMNAMRRLTALNETEVALLLAYLQSRAK
jgi:trimethylamine-N-oxide reductase cytochrome c-type subunit TorC